jgi:hypothetical protein
MERIAGSGKRDRLFCWGEIVLSLNTVFELFFVMEHRIVVRCEVSRAKEDGLSWERVVLWIRRQAGRLSYIA